MNVILDKDALKWLAAVTETLDGLPEHESLYLSIEVVSQNGYVLGNLTDELGNFALDSSCGRDL